MAFVSGIPKEETARVLRETVARMTDKAALDGGDLLVFTREGEGGGLYVEAWWTPAGEAEEGSCPK
jgi:hypothetical protein